MNKKILIAAAVILVAVVSIGVYYYQFSQIVTTYYRVDMRPSGETNVEELNDLGSEEATIDPVREDVQGSYQGYMREYGKVLEEPEDFNTQYKLGALENLMNTETQVVVIRYTRAFRRKVADLLNGDADDIFDALEDMQESGDVESVEIVPIEKVSVD